MGIKEALQKIPREGFLKVSSQRQSDLSSSDRTILIRKANELFNEGQLEQAKRIFLATGYSDGIIRMGDYYFENEDHLEALRMYWMAPAPNKVEELIERFTGVVQKWMNEDEKEEKE